MEYSGQPAESDIESGMARGKKLMDNAYKPRYAQQTGTPETRDRLMSALLGFRSGFEEAGKYIQQGNPIAATIAGISGGLTGPTPQTVATQRFQNEQQAQAAQFAMTPLFQVSPLLAKENPEFAEMPMAEFSKYAPTLEKLHTFENKLKEIEARGIETRKTGEEKLKGQKELEIFKGFERDVPVTPNLSKLYTDAGFDAPTQKLVSKEEVAAVSRLAAMKTSGAISATKEEKKSTMKVSKEDERILLSTMRLTNPATAMRGSLLGTAGLANMRADRALQLLRNPNATPQDITMVITDLSGIMHGGSPQEQELKQAQYGTLMTDIMNLKTKLTSRPSSAKQPEILAKLIEVIREVKQVDNAIIENNLTVYENLYSEMISRNPEKWARHRDNILRYTLSPGGTAESKSGTTSAGWKVLR